MDPIFTQITQVALVVKDVEKTVRTFADEYGIGPWNIYTLDSATVKEMEIGERRKDYRYKQATTYIGSTHFEIIEPLDDESIYAEFLRNYGEGIHHIAFSTDHDKTMEFFHKKGKKAMQAGTICGKHKFSYVDCMDDLKMIVEFNKEEPGFQMPEPDAVYPER